MLSKTSLKTYHLDPANFILAPELAWQTALRKTEVKVELFTDIDMLLMSDEMHNKRNMSRSSSICKS